MRNRHRLLVAAGLLLLSRSAFAATRTWDGSSSANWNTAANWAENAVPAAGDDLVFPSGAMNTTMNNNIAAATAFNTITFSAGGYTITGNGLGIVSTISATNNLGTNTIQPAVTLSATTTISAVSGGTLTLSGGVVMGSHPLDASGTGVVQISGPITGSAILSKGGTGDLTLSGTNTYAGATVVNAGTLTIASAGALGTAAAGTTVASGAALLIGSGVTSSEPITVTGSGILGNGALRGIAGGGTLSGPITFAAGGGTTIGAITNETLTISGAIGSASGATPLTKVGAGTLVLTGPNTYAGVTIVSAGVLNARNATALGDFASGTSVSSGAALELQGGFSTNENLSLVGAGVSSQGALRNISGTNAVYGTVALTASSSIGVDAASYLFLGGVVSGGGTLTKVGAGNLVLTGANTFTSSVSVNAGVLSVQNDSALGTTDFGTTVATGAALEVQGNVTIAEPLTLSGTGISNGGALRNVLDANTWSGPIALVTLPSIYTLTSSQLTVSGVISGNTPLVKSGNGTLVLSAANTFGQAFNVTGGTAVVTGSLDPATPTTLSSGTTLKGTGTTGVVNVSGGTVSPGLSPGILSTQGITLTASSTYTAEINGLAVGSLYDQIVSAGPVTLAGTLNVTVAPGTDTPAASQFMLIKNDSGAPVSGTFAGLPEGAVVNAGGYKFTISYQGGDGNDVVISKGNFSHAWTGAVSSLWSNPGNWDSPPFPGDSVYFGASAVNFTSTNDLAPGFDLTEVDIGAPGYTIDLAGASIKGSLFTIQATYASGTSTVTLASSMDHPFTFLSNNAGATLVVNGGVSLTGGDLTLDGAGNVTVGASLNGTGGLVKTGAGTAVLSGASGYTGTTSILGGTLEIQSSFALGNGAAGTSVATGATLRVDGVAFSEPLTIDGQGAGNTGALRFSAGDSVLVAPVAVTSSAWIVVEGVVNATLSGVVSGGGITKQGSGRLILSGANTFTGPLFVNGGFLQAANASALGATSAGSTANPGGTLELVGGIAIGNEPLGITLSGFGAVGALRSVSGANSWNGPIQLNGDATIGVDAGTLTLNGAVNGAYLLAKKGPGSLVLNGNNNYVGSTMLLSGPLFVNGLQSQSAVMCGAGSTLGGVGLTGAVTSSAATVAPGQSPGVLSVGNLSLDSGSTFAVELNGTTAGSGYDRLNVTGSVNLGTAALTVSTGFAPTIGDTFTLIANDGVDPVNSVFAGHLEGTPFNAGIYRYAITYAGGDGNDVVLTFLGCPSDASGPTVTPPPAVTVTQTACN